MKERNEVRQRSREHWKCSKLNHDPQHTKNNNNNKKTAKKSVNHFQQLVID